MESREIKTSYTSNNNKMKVWFALFLVKGKRLVKVNYLDCVAIRMLHQIFSEVLNALSISIQGEEMQFAMDSLFEIEITFYCNLKKCLCLVRSYYLQTWHRISCMTNTLHSPAYFYLRSIKTEPIRDIPFWKKKHLHSPTNSNQLQQLNLRFFFSL